MEQPRAVVRGDRFWRGIAVAVVVLIASGVGVVAIDSLRTWRKDDQAAAREAAVEKQRIAAEQQHLAAERQRQLEIATAEGQRRDRAALVRAEVQSHPERMQTFAVGSTVRVRSSAPQELLRGLACSVFSEAPVRDEESGEVWMLNYSLYVLPLLQIDGTLDLTPVWVAAEHLAAAGAAEDTEDLRRNPVLAKRAAEQAGRIADADRRSRALPALQEGDPVVIAETDPRSALRGRAGRVLAVHRGEVVCDPTAPDPRLKVEAATCDVILDLDLDDNSSSALPVRVKVWDLARAPARPRRR